MARDIIHHPIPKEFEDIAPYTDANFKQKLEQLVKEPGVEHAVRYIMPDVDYKKFTEDLLKVDTQDDFQRYVMGYLLQKLEKQTTDGISIDGLDKCCIPEHSYTFITNHRDIVLDASFLNLCFIRNDMPITQVAIGNNLLIYEWITDLVKLNRSFIVKRDVKMVQALEAAKQLSAYIHYTINHLHESVWIAQREGRAKDSNDLTQESLIKMLSLAGGGTVKENLLAVNLCPVSISYEYDPNDYLKAREFLLKKRDPQFKKSQHDDLFSMETGILKYKGRVMFRLGECINPQLEKFPSDNRLEVIRETCRLIDNAIHAGYEIYQCNYIAYDELHNTDRFAQQYDQGDVEKFNAYINKQLDKVDVPDVTPEERDYMRHMMLSMYANPLKNKLQQCGSLSCQSS
ncbi:MAG: acyltransferase [Bacteroidales bacterium]|nr:acyltransferase [Bacteroidales bacterium]